MTPLLWQRPSHNQARTRYHATHDGRTLCGVSPHTPMTLPRVLTARQIETQGCRKCVAKVEEMA